MKKEELKNIISLSIAIAAVLSVAYLTVLKVEFNRSNIIRSVNFGISITTIFWTFYISYGWKLCLLNQIFYRPNLNGTWAGKLVSDWIDENGNTVNPISFYIVIRQTFLTIHFTTFTENFVGVSYAETFSLSKEKGIKNLAYMYRKDTTQTNDNFLREGATELWLIISDNNRQLDGKYWSNTKTQGNISVSFISEKHVDSFADAKTLENG